MKVEIPQDLQEELKHVVESYYKKQKKGKKTKYAKKDKQDKKSRVLQAVSSASNERKGKTHKKPHANKKTRKSDFSIEQRSYTYTNINGKERKSSKEIIGDRNRIKITTVDPNGKKNVVTMPTPQKLIPNSNPTVPLPLPISLSNRSSLSSPFKSFKNDNMLLSLKPMMPKQNLLNPSYLR